jgi:2-oxoglutarate ferredoxin oxidoreductase subunit beta
MRNRTPLLTSAQTSYCPGCGHGIAHRVIAELLEEMNLRDRAIGIAPVGCAVLMYNNIDIDFVQAAHGRAPAVATGIRRALPDAFLFTYQGDGDLASIGMGEIIHAAYRGENLSVVFINNATYGMTGGQMAPTTPLQTKTKTSARGRNAKDNGFPVHICELLASIAPVQYLERVAVHTPRDVIKTKRAIKKSFEIQVAGKGFSLVEVIGMCPENWYLTPVEALTRVQEMIDQEFPLGVFKDAGKNP